MKRGMQRWKSCEEEQGNVTHKAQKAVPSRRGENSVQRVSG